VSGRWPASLRREAAARREPERPPAAAALGCVPRFAARGSGGSAWQGRTVFVSLLASCGLHKLEPWTYLRDLFCLLPGWPKRRVLDLAPAYWKKTLQDEKTQQRLADNPFRSAVITLDRLHPDDT